MSSVMQSRSSDCLCGCCRAHHRVDKAQRLVASMCSRARNEYACRNLKANFADGMAEVARIAGEGASAHPACLCPDCAAFQVLKVCLLTLQSWEPVHVHQIHQMAWPCQDCREIYEILERANADLQHIMASYAGTLHLLTAVLLQLRAS